MIDLDKPCPHITFAGSIVVHRCTRHGDPTGFLAHVEVHCADCGEQFRFTGLDAGMSPHRPMCSTDEATLNAPIRPASDDPDFGLDAPGYAIGLRERPQ